MKRDPKPTYYNSSYHKALYDVFLSYLNYPFEDCYQAIKSFENEQKIMLSEYLSEENIQAGYHLSMPGLMPLELDGIFREIIQQSTKHLTLAISDYHRYHKLLEGKGVGFEYSPYFDTAFESVWGSYFRECGACWYDGRTSTGQCHKCDQEAFIELVEILLESGEFTQLLDELLFRRNQFVKSYVFRTCDGLQEIQIFHAADYFREAMPGEQYLFSRFVMGLMGFSIITFYQNYRSWENLKKCPYCGLFFIAKDLKRTFCYDAECVKIYRRNKKRKQRKDEAGIYFS